jgi:hypothetical protein
MTLDESIQGMRLHVIRRATQIGVSAACAEAGHLPDPVLSVAEAPVRVWGRRAASAAARRAAGAAAPADAAGRAADPRGRDSASNLELSRLAAYVARWWRLSVAPSTVQRLLRRHGLRTRRERLLVLEHPSAQQSGLLTERTRRALWQGRYGEPATSRLRCSAS